MRTIKSIIAAIIKPTRKKSIMVAACLIAAISVTASAQSVDAAKRLIDNKRYLEAAKMLRPLAERGDAEAQYLAATLFFEGKGVKKSIPQALKYAGLSANQGNGKAYYFLLSYYHEYAHDNAKYEQTLVQSKGDWSPQRSDDRLNRIFNSDLLAYYDKQGNYGTVVKFMERRSPDQFDESSTESGKRKLFNLYWKYKLQDRSFTAQYGTTDPEVIADKLFEYKWDLESDIDDARLFKATCPTLHIYIFDTKYHSSLDEVRAAADAGNLWAQAEYAYALAKTDKNSKDARLYARKSYNGDCRWGKKLYSEIASMSTFKSVEKAPQFPGGATELMKWVSAHLQYPVLAQEKNIQGRVIVQFIIEEDGSIGEVKVVRSVDKLLDNEAVRLVKSLPNFEPGKINDKPVATWHTLPVTFRLQSK